jgi:hypothetical protein
MEQNNLRVIYQNLADSATITASTTAGVTSTDNLKKDAKSLVWRSATGATRANLVVTFTNSVIGGVILPFCNLTSAATIQVRGYTGNAPTTGTGNVPVPNVGTGTSPVAVTGTTQVFNTGAITAAPYQSVAEAGTLSVNSNSYAYGAGTYGRVWIPIPATCTSLLIEIVDTGNSDGYIEVSRLVIGPYWSPKFNTSFGLSTSFKDLSTNSRTESGDLITNRNVRYRSMNFDMQYLTPDDRTSFTKILKGIGVAKGLFISLFPNNSDDFNKEHSHQIYGKLSQIADINHPLFGVYSTTVDIEEV